MSNPEKYKIKEKFLIMLKILILIVLINYQRQNK